MKILIELFVVFLIAYGIYHEDKLVEIEDKMLYFVRRKFKKVYGKLYGRYIETLRRSLH